MATKFQIKRSSVSGRTPNTTNAANSSYIAAGELAVNLTDGKLYSSDGTSAFEVGANLTSLAVTSLSAGNTTITGFANVSGNVYIGNSTVFWTANSTEIDIGTTTINTTAVAAGANVVANTSAFFVGNSTVNLVANSTSLLTGNAQIYSNGTALFGTATALGKFTISDPGATTLTLERIVDNSGPPEAIGRKARGVVGAKTGVLSGDRLWFFAAAGYVGTEGVDGSYSANKVGMNFVASENWSNTAQGAHITFATTEAGQTTRTDKVIISGNGNVGIGNNAPTNKLRVEGDASILTTLSAGNTTITGFANVSGNVYIGNSTVFWTANSTEIDIGTTTVNTTAIAAGANVIANTSTIFIGNSTVNTTVNSSAISVTKIIANGSIGTSDQVLTSNGTGIYWGTGGGTTFTISSQTFIGNGSNTQYTLSTSTTNDESFVFLNGVAQVPVTDYSISGTTLTFVVAPVLSEQIEVRTINIPSILGIQFTLDSYTGNGSNTIYTLSTSLSTSNNSFVYLNGVAQVPTTDYSVSGSTLTFTTAPPDLQQIRVVTINPTGSYEADSFTANSTSNNNFTLSIPTTTFRAMVFINGVAQAPSVDYYVSGTTLILTSNAALNDIVTVRSFFEEPSSSGPNTAVQYNANARLKGSAGFTFDETTNNVTIANTLTVPNFILNASNPPASPTAAGTTGTFAWDSNYFYIATGTNTWRKVNISANGVGGSNTNILYNDSNTLAGSAGFTFNNTTNNVTIANTLLIGANVTVNTSTIFIGNSSVNTTITAGNVHLQGTQLTVGNTVLTGQQITVGNSTVNSVIRANGATFTGDLMPSANVTYDIGNSAMRWRDLWLSGTTINLGGATIKTDTDTGAIAFVPKATVGVPNPKAVVVSPRGGIQAVDTTDGVPIINNSITTVDGVLYGNSTVNTTINSSSVSTIVLNVAGTSNVSGNTGVAGFIIPRTLGGLYGNAYITASNNAGGNSWIRIVTQSGYTEIGPQNASYSHFYTDRNRFYFSKITDFDGGIRVYNANVIANSSGFFADQANVVVGNSTVNSVLTSTSLSTGNVTVTGDLVVSGNVFFNGSTTNVNSTNLVVEDKNIILGDVATPSDVTANGGGITLKGTTDKTLNWVDATDAWTSSEDFNLVAGKSYEINGTVVVNSTSLGTGITGSSLTSVGTLTTLAAGNTTITGFANVTTSVNSAAFTVGTSFIANTTVVVAPLGVVVRGGGATSEGGQIILGYGNNLATTITGQSNYTWNIDVIGGNTGSTPLLRVFAQNGDGSTTSGFSIANTGRMHVGSTGEQTDSTFKVTGSANVTTTLSAGNTTITGFANVTTTLQVGTNTATFGTAAYIVANGNVGIGASSPADILHVRKDSTGNIGAIIQNRSATGTPESGVKFISGAFDLSDSRYSEIASAGGSSSDLSLRTSSGGAPTTKVYVAANGNVGIGNTAPTAPLCVNGNVILGNTTTTGTLVVYNTNADANVAGGVTVDVNGPVLRVGDRNIARTFANGVGIKIHDSGAVHYSVGQIGNAFVIADTSSDADSLYPASRTNILSANSTLATIGVPFNVSSTYTTFGSTGQTTLSLTTSATTANQVVATAVVLGAAVWRSVKYQVQVTSGSAYQFTEISIVHDGTTVYKSEYGTVLSGALLATFDADISGGNIRLLTTPVNAVTVYKGLATMVAV
jgi:hypothetical protein